MSPHAPVDPGDRMTRRTVRVCVVGALAAITVVQGCKSSGRATPQTKKPALPAPSEAAAPPDDSVRVAPVIAPVARYGLEITWWTADDSDASLGSTLHGLALPDQRIDPDTLDRLRVQGIRPVRIAESSLLELTSAAEPTAGIERVWIGLAPDWTPTRFPAPLGATDVRMVPGLSAPTAIGMLRLLWRAYIGAEGLAPVLRMDLTGQAISADFARARMSDRNARSGGEARLPRPVDAGPMIDALNSTLVFRPGEVIVIVADNPDADWSAKPRPSVSDFDDPDAPPPPPPPSPMPLTAEEPEPLDADDQPPAPRTPSDAPTSANTIMGSAPEELPIAKRNTFGELLLTPELPTRPGRPGKLIIALIPQIPETLELIPEPRPEPAR